MIGGGSGSSTVTTPRSIACATFAGCYILERRTIGCRQSGASVANDGTDGLIHVRISSMGESVAGCACHHGDAWQFEDASMVGLIDVSSAGGTGDACVVFHGWRLEICHVRSAGGVFHRALVKAIEVR
jgi:hypothetical protein